MFDNQRNMEENHWMAEWTGRSFLPNFTTDRDHGYRKYPDGAAYSVDRQLLEISAAELNSDEASVLIRDGDQGDLRFLSAIGKVAGS